ncbi:MAG: hypothetical protein EBV86_03200 [Marivivens sp.]|nr:hypothetical protein [Marivivens sp.]
MARLRQQFPQNYGSSGNINTEFENLVRYVNAAEFGGNTVGELLAKIFDANGVWDGPVELRKDSSSGIQYRIGEYTDETTGWVTLVTLAEIRGESGQDVGTIGAPILFGRVDFVATASQTDFDYAHESTDELLVYKDGVLQREGGSYDYTTDDTGGSASAGVVTFNSGLTVGTKVAVFKVRATAITGYTRTDTVPPSNQTVFPFTFTEDTKLQVYKNGILLEEGGSNDYTLQPANNTVTLTTAATSSDTVTILTVENTSVQAVTGMMFEENYVDSTSGLIQFAKISIADAAIAQAKVSGLVSGLGEKAKLTVSGSTPSTPASGDLWMDTSVTPNQLKFYDGTQWLRTSPESSLPTFSTSNAGQVVQVNATGTALQYAAVDLSSVIATTQRGAANGVASLDSTGRLPAAQLPLDISSDSFYLSVATPTNSTYTIKKIYGQKIRVDGYAFSTTSGSCDVQLEVGGTAIGTAQTANSTGGTFDFGTPSEFDATSSPVTVAFIVTNNSSAANLEVTIGITVIST